MRTIYKYELQIESSFTIDLPISATPKKVAYQNGTPYMWAMVNTDSRIYRHTIHCVATGEKAPANADYFGTVINDKTGNVWHFFMNRDIYELNKEA